MKKTTQAIGIAALVLIVLIAASAFINTNKKAQNLGGKNIELVKLGALLSLTGKFAGLGEDTRNGIELAREELKARGINIEIVYEDAASEPKVALPAATKLTESDKVPVVFAGPGSSVNLAVAPQMQKGKTVFIVASATPKLNTEGEYIFKILPDIDPEIEQMVSFMVSKSVKKLGVLFDTTSDTQVYGNGLVTKLFEAYAGNKVYSQGFDGKASDYRAQIAQLKKDKPDAIYILSNEKNAGIAVKQIRELGLNQQIYSWSGAVGGEFFKGAGASAEGVIVTDQPFSCNGNELMKKYCKDYAVKFPNYIPLPYGAHAYDALKIIGSVLEKQPNLRGENLQKAVMAALTSKTYSGTSGDLAFDEAGNITKHKFEIRVAKGGVFVNLEN